MTQPSTIHVVSTENIIDEAMESVIHMMRDNYPL